MHLFSITLTGVQAAAKPALVVLSALGLATGIVAQMMGHAAWADGFWVAATLPVLAALIVEIVTSLRRGDFGLDIVAALSMTAALAFGVHLAAVVIALMYAGGQYLESLAKSRARREMTALLSRAPRSAIRYRDGELEEVTLDAIAPGDGLLMRRGDVVPVDGVVANGTALLDESALTGESLPVCRGLSEAVMSGVTNIGDAFDLVAAQRAANSTYAGIVRLVDQAHRSKAPMGRLADRYAMVFLAVTVALAFAAWLLSGDPIRAVAVLVVATPCPLILAVPVALASGMSTAAKHGILIKGAEVIEMLARIRAIVIDKTGTLTVGKPSLAPTRLASGLTPDELLRLAASLEQASKHTIANTLVEQAHQRGLVLSIPSRVVETAGEGVEGSVDGQSTIVGSPRFVAAKLGMTPGVAPSVGEPRNAPSLAVARDGKFVGELILADQLRPGTEPLLAALRQAGVERIVLATGDRRDVADAIGSTLSLDSIRAELAPEQKIAVVLAERRFGPVMMIGDGVNDAPALAAADVGVAMGARGDTVSSEAADVVLLVDRLDRVLPAICIAKQSRRIALQSIYVGIGLSVAAMIAAAFGYITPVQGAILQEAIDVAVIFNALRALAAPSRALL